MVFKSIEKKLVRYMFEWQGISKMKWIPFGMLLLILPILNMMQFSKYKMSELFLLHVLKSAMIVVAISSVFWIICIFQEYYETNGNELLFLYGKCKFVLVFKCLMLYSTVLLIPLMVYSILNACFVYEYFRLLVIALFMMILSYFIIVLSHSATITWILMIAYIIYNVMFQKGEYRSYLFYYEEWINWEMIRYSYVPMVIISVFLIVFGQLFALKFDQRRFR